MITKISSVWSPLPSLNWTLLQFLLNICALELKNILKTGGGGTEPFQCEITIYILHENAWIF